MKIGITLNMSFALWANGMQQNIVFLYEILKELGNECLYITPEEPKYGLSKNHTGIVLNDLIKDNQQKLDVLIVAGFDLPDVILDELKLRNPNMKTILIHYGNKLFDDIHYGITSENIPQKTPISTPKHIDCIWTSPHYAFAKDYLETYHDCEVKICPYIWDSFFIDEKLRQLKEKNINPNYSSNFTNKVCIFEPNKNPTKTSLLPIMICEKYESLYPNEIESINVFCSSKIRERDYFIKYINKLKIGQKKDFIFFNNRWSKLEAVSKFGNIIVSHQLYNDLNYSHLESLYLGLPLIHNSVELQNVGYYYPEFNIKLAAKQLKNAKINHNSTLNQYKEDAKEIFHKFSIYNKDNINTYRKLLD